METYYGIFAIWATISAVLYYLITHIAKKVNLPNTPDDKDVEAIPYCLSIILFVLFSSISLYLCVVLTVAKTSASTYIGSGLALAVRIWLVGCCIRLLHKFFSWILLTLFKFKLHKLMSEEIEWTWIFLFATYALAYLRVNNTNIAFSFLALIIAYFLWVGTSLHDILKQIQKIKKLSLAYWYVFLFLSIIMAIIIRYQKDPFKTTLGVIGYIVGAVIYLILHIVNKRWNSSQKREK